ncbi:hypothetical protein M8J77_008724 [Diaphorina citri]|nr:hypothetical protein M8J77_008724 [Diaphorina citri]
MSVRPAQHPERGRKTTTSTQPNAEPTHENDRGSPPSPQVRSRRRPRANRTRASALPVLDKTDEVGDRGIKRGGKEKEEEKEEEKKKEEKKKEEEKEEEEKEEEKKGEEE